MKALSEEDDPKVLTTTIESLAEEEEETISPSERLRQRRLRCVYWLRVLTTTTAALAD